MEWNYYNTFIKVALDCPAETGTVPLDKKDGKTKHGIEFELISQFPYKYTQEELLYEVYIRHKGFSQEELEQSGTEIKEQFFAKPKPCMRASMLPKKYGWGIHFDHEGKMALVSMEAPEYSRFADGEQEGVKLLAAMRNKRQ